ncbi:hypothetical protein CCR75_003032 [Bremia lactucae]|uniref:Mediator complex subunit 15 KIX domain-containing protein n=1 Tax=Bremia lactucae TaxID=4779 RepID=A0A976NZY5_BRELC|nr:hypothetical protein CCR75_003032 [Bremia lactucae]
MNSHSLGIQGGGMSMPMSMSMGSAPTMGLDANSQNQQQNVMMNTVPMGSVGMTLMNSNVLNAAQVSDWRIQLTREHRANLIAKIYNEMVRVSADPMPGIKLWMNVSWYELSLYKESLTQEVYINKIFTRLKSLRVQQSNVSAAMAAQGLPNQGLLSRLDFSYYNTLNLDQRGTGGGNYSGHNQINGLGPVVATQQQQQLHQQEQQSSASASSTPVKSETSVSGNSVAEYWQQHAALRAKHQGDVEKVHNAFKKYVDHMNGHDETEQKKKLRYLLSYVELCANILSENKATHQPRKIEELDKVFKYIVKIVNPYLKKLRTEAGRRGGDSSTLGLSGLPSTSTGPGIAPSMGATPSVGSNKIPKGVFNGTNAQAQLAEQPHQQNAMNPTTQQKQQQYLIQQRVHQMQHQQQQMQAQVRRQQLMEHQQLMRQQQIQQQKGPQQQAQLSSEQANLLKYQQQNSQIASKQLSGQQTQQGTTRQQQPNFNQPQRLAQSQQAQTTQNQSQNQNLQLPTSRGESPSMSSGSGVGLDDSLYGGMSNDLLQMPTPSSTLGGLMDFPNELSPTSFGGMDLLDWDDGTSGTAAIGASPGDTSDIMTFVETL